MYMNRPYILLIDIFNVFVPTQNIQLVDEVNIVIAEGKAVELLGVLSKYRNHEVIRIESHNNTLIIEIG